MNALLVSSGDVLVSNPTIDSAFVMLTGNETCRGWEHVYPYSLARRIVEVSCFVEGIVTQNRLLHQSDDAARVQQTDTPSTKQSLRDLPMTLMDFQSAGGIFQSIATLSGDFYLEVRDKIIDFFLKRQWHQRNFTPVQNPSIETISSTLSLPDENPIRMLAMTEDKNPVTVMSMGAVEALDTFLGYGIPLMANAYEYPAFLMYLMGGAAYKTYEIKVPSLFSAILERCQSHLEVFKTALQFRQTKAAQAFQGLLSSINNDENLSHFENERSKLQELADQLAKEIDTEPRAVTAQFLVTSMPKETFVQREKRLFFCFNTFQEESTLKKMQESIRRVFDVDGQITTSLIKELLA